MKRFAALFAERTGILAFQVSSERKPLMGSAQVAEHQQREPAVQAIAGLLLRTHVGQAIFGALEDLGGFDVVPVGVKVRPALHGVSRTTAQAEHHGNENDGGQTKHCLPV